MNRHDSWHEAVADLPMLALFFFWWWQQCSFQSSSFTVVTLRMAQKCKQCGKGWLAEDDDPCAPCRRCVAATRTNPSPAAARADDRSGVSETVLEEQGIPFTTPNGNPLKADVYLPAGVGGDTTPLLPALLLVHGGGWTAGSRRDERRLARRLAAEVTSLRYM